MRRELSVEEESVFQDQRSEILTFLLFFFTETGSGSLADP